VVFKDYDGSQIGDIQTVKARRSATKPDDPTRTGYTFKGWDGNYTNIKENTTLTATYEIINYTITYNNMEDCINNNDNPATYTIESNDITLKDAEYRQGNYFDGWYSDQNFEQKVTSIPKGSTGNIILYAKWVSKSTNQGLWVEDIEPQMYTGSAIKPTVIVHDGGKTLILNKDYTISYKNNTKVNEDYESKLLLVRVIILDSHQSTF
jgi:uncharacterized repeat protein (TIGR02543 family)